jgi:hypothetical protein
MPFSCLCPGACQTDKQYVRKCTIETVVQAECKQQDTSVCNKIIAEGALRGSLFHAQTKAIHTLIQIHTLIHVLAQPGKGRAVESSGLLHTQYKTYRRLSTIPPLTWQQMESLTYSVQNPREAVQLTPPDVVTGACSLLQVLGQ